MFKSLILFLLFIQGEIPYKPSNEFELKLDFTVQQSQRADPYTMSYDLSKEEKLDKEKGASLPYLKIKLIIQTISKGEARIKILDNKKNIVSKKKVVAGSEVTINWGFAEDIKDQIVTNEYTILFLDTDQNPVSRIYLFIDEDGTFLVNEEKRGKF